MWFLIGLITRRPGIIIEQNDTDFKAVISYVFCSQLLELWPVTINVIAMVYTILVFQRPKWLLSGSLEHETSMDIERIVVGEIAAI